MPLITITSDLGNKDYYLAALKGALYCNGVNTPIVDITHSIKPFDLKEAAYVVRNAYKHFPKGSIHIVHVNASGGNNRLLLATADGHYFISFDNGFLSLAFDKIAHQTYQINDELLQNKALLSEDSIGKVANLLAQEYRPSDFAHLITETVDLRMLQPLTSPGSIRGTVIHIDHFGNAIVNITRPMFNQFIGERRFTILANVGSTKLLSTHYTEVDEGDMVCLFNAGGYLEIAINKGKAENLLGLKIDSPVLVMAD
jgi:S-adenosylmethionine hydrolase